MNRILVDSNVILDILEDDPVWYSWSEEILGRYHETHTLLINPIIYAEVSVGFESVEEVEEIFHEIGFQMVQIPKEALFLAGKVFMAYRKRGGTRRSPLPDFFIGAHAAVENLPLLTRDISRYQTDFPTVDLIAPNDSDK